MNKPKMNKTIKTLVEFLPIAIFFIFYKLFNLTYATASIIVTSFISILITYHFEKKINFVTVFSCVILGFFGGLTIYSGNTMFIKIKPTIINLLFAVILFIGIYKNKGLIKHILGHSIKLSEENWLIISKRWGFFFIFLALINEIVWRNFSENFWVNFKVFGFTLISAVFLISQLSFITKNIINDAASPEADK